MPESKELRYLKKKLKKAGRRFKTPEELRAEGVVGSSLPPISALYEIPENQYEQAPLPDDTPSLGGYALWHKHEGLDRAWAVKTMVSLPDSLDWQFAGITAGRRKMGESGTLPTMTARYVYKTLSFKLAVTWLISPTDEGNIVGLRFIRATGETGARWCHPSEVKAIITALLDAEYESVDPEQETFLATVTFLSFFAFPSHLL